MFFPFLLLTILEVLLRGNMLPEQFLPARVLGILAGMGGIVVGFYTLRGVLGRNYDALNIALYFAGVLLSLFVENKPPVVVAVTVYNPVENAHLW